MSTLVDTGVWLAFCDPRERPAERDQVEQLFENLEFSQLLLPWPIVYETIRTRLSRNKAALGRLQVALTRPNIVFVDDTSYREDAFDMVFELSVQKQPPRPLSMVDCLLRVVLADATLKIDRFATYNDGDFADVCASRRIELIK